LRWCDEHLALATNMSAVAQHDRDGYAAACCIICRMQLVLVRPPSCRCPPSWGLPHTAVAQASSRGRGGGGGDHESWAK
jgi:hypothetical protein